MHRLVHGWNFTLAHIDRSDPVVSPVALNLLSIVSLLYFADGHAINLSRLLTRIWLDLRCWSWTYAQIIFSLQDWLHRGAAASSLPFWISHFNTELITKKNKVPLTYTRISRSIFMTIFESPAKYCEIFIKKYPIVRKLAHLSDLTWSNFLILIMTS